jgi:hypothetical protein
MWLITMVSIVTAQADVVESATGDIVPQETSVNVVKDAPKPPIPRLTWKSDEKRFFAAKTVDAGYLYIIPRLSLG